MGQVSRWQYSQGGSSGTGEQVAVLTGGSSGTGELVAALTGGLKWDR